MSTRSSIYYSESSRIHLWRDVIDEHVYLGIEGPSDPVPEGKTCKDVGAEWEEACICMDREAEAEFEEMCRAYIRWVDEAATWRRKR